MNRGARRWRQRGGAGPRRRRAGVAARRRRGADGRLDALVVAMGLSSSTKGPVLQPAEKKESELSEIDAEIRGKIISFVVRQLICPQR